MLDLKELRAKVDRYAADTMLVPYDDSVLSGHKVWMEALENNELLFSGGVDGRVHYDSFLDIDFTGPEIHNQEWRAQLNRYAWLAHLAVEYQKTGDERWAQIARETIEAWLDYRTFRGDETVEEVWPNFGDNTLSASIRLGQNRYAGWFGSLPYFNGSAAFDEAFVERMYRSAGEQLVFLLHNNRRYGNFRISELQTMLFLSQVLPGFESYADYAVRNLNATFRFQVEPDGAHEEHTLGYHNWMCRIFTQMAVLAKNRPALGLRIDPDRLAAMYEYTFANLTPDNRQFGINDTGRWHPDADDRDAAFFGAYSGGLTGKEYYARLCSFLGLEPKEESSFRRFFPDAGQYFFRDGCDALTLDATIFSGWHGHVARGSLLFFHGDRLQLCDPGSLNYERSDPFMRPGRLTPLHNTVTVNGWSQNPESNAEVPVCVDTPDYSFFQCVYPGGYTTDPLLDRSTNRSCAGRHVRTMVWVKGRFALVYDVVDVRLETYEYAAHWQFLDEPVDFDAASLSMHTKAPGYNLLVRCLWADGLVEAKQYCGDFEKKLGYIAGSTGGLGSGKPAPMLSVEGTSRNGEVRQMLTVLAPYEGENLPEISAECCGEDETVQIHLRYNGEDWYFAADSHFIAALPYGSQVGERAALCSDGPAALLGPKGPAVYDGTWAKRRDN